MSKEEKKRTIENFRLEYMFPQYFNEAIMNFFKTRVSHKLSDKNPIKKILSKIENKTTNGWFYKTLCILGIIYIGIIQLLAFNQNIPAAKAMLVLTSFFTVLIFMGFNKPLLRLSSITQALQPGEIFKLIAKYDDKKLIKNIIIQTIKHILKRIFIVVIICSIFTFSLHILKSSSSNNILESFVSDITLKVPFSPNIYLNFLLLIIFFSSFFTIFSNINYSYETVVIQDKLKGIPLFLTLIIILMSTIFVIALPNVYSHLGKVFDGTDILILIGISIYVFFVLFYVAAFLHALIRKIALSYDYRLTKKD